MAEVTVKFGGDVDPLKRATQDAMGEIEKLKKKASAGGEGGVFERESKVKHHLIGLASELGSVQSFANLGVVAVEHLSEVFKNTLGTAIALGVGGALVSAGIEGMKSLDDLEEKAKEIDKTVEELGGQSLPELTASFKNFSAAAAKGPDVGSWKTMGRNLGEHVAGFFHGNMNEADDKRIEIQLKNINAAGDAHIAITEELKKQAEIEEMRTAGQTQAADLAQKLLDNKRELNQLEAAGYSAFDLNLVKRRQNALIEAQSLKDQAANKKADDEERTKRLKDLDDAEGVKKEKSHDRNVREKKQRAHERTEAKTAEDNARAAVQKERGKHMLTPKDEAEIHRRAKKVTDEIKTERQQQKMATDIATIAKAVSKFENAISVAR